MVRTLSFVLFSCAIMSGCASMTSHEIKQDRPSVTIQRLRSETEEAVVISALVAAYYAQKKEWPRHVTDIIDKTKGVDRELKESFVIQRVDHDSFLLSKKKSLLKRSDAFDILLKILPAATPIMEGKIIISSQEYDYNVNMTVRYKYLKNGGLDVGTSDDSSSF